MKLAHIADTHIKLLKHHDNYRVVFEELYSTLRAEKVDYIIHCGDLFHNKTHLSPESVALTSDFLTKLSEIAPVFIINGNHDGNLKNAQRQDAITPIVEAINSKKIKLLKNSGEVVLDDLVSLNVLSIFDRSNWAKPTNRDKINIALYHGAIEGARTDTGWRMKDTDDDVSIFNDFDFAFLGDIHKQQYLNKSKTIAYCGSTVQQNFGEEDNKGLLLWDIKSKTDFSSKSICFKNPNPFITIEYKGEESLKGTPGAYLRIILDKYYSHDEVQRIEAKAHELLSPKTIIFLEKRANAVESSIEEAGNKKLNLRDNEVQKGLIREFLESEELDDDTLNAVLELNDKYNLNAEINEDTARNTKWSLESFDWDNLFNYKEGNKITFSNLSGIVGIFGENYSGKSSVIDGLLYTLFNSTSKKIRKNFDVVNEKKDLGRGEVTIRVDNGSYFIERTTEKKRRKSKGKIVEEGKTDLNFEFLSDDGEAFSVNGNDRNETDKNIRKQLGSVEDFCNTSLSTQHGSLDFIREGSTKRKEILANFLDLQIFERKYKPANQYSNELKMLIKKLEGKGTNEKIGALDEGIESSKKNLDIKVGLLRSEKLLFETKREALASLKKDLDKVSEPVNIDSLLTKKQEVEKTIRNMNSLVALRTESLNVQKEFLQKAGNVIEKFDIEALRDKKQASDLLLTNIDILLAEKKTKENSLALHRKNASLLDLAACGRDQYTECSFKKGASESVQEIEIATIAINAILDKYHKLGEEIISLDSEKTSEYIKKYEELVIKISNCENCILRLEKEIAEFNASLFVSGRELLEAAKDVDNYMGNKALYENLELLYQSKTKLEGEMSQAFSQMNILETSKDLLIAEVASKVQQKTGLEEQAKELEALNEEYSAYQLFLMCVHNNGIPFELVKRTLPLLNEEMNSLLVGIVGFKAFFEDEDGKLEIYIQHPGHGQRAIENCSGSEKSLVSMAIRMALIKCGSLPTSDIFILDEPATALDSKHMDSFIKILEMIKSQFKIVLLITHLEVLKDSVDKIIEIQKDDEGYAYIN